MQKLPSYLKAYKKMNSKSIRDLNIKFESSKLLEIIAGFLCELGLSNDFIDSTPKKMIHKINN